MGIILGVLTVVLIFVSLFLILVVLAQKSKDGGMGAALGGGAAEAAFGAETSNVLSKSTKWAAVLFFVLAFVLYLGRIAERSNAQGGGADGLPTITTPATPAATTAPAPAPAVPMTTAPEAAKAAPATTTTTTPAAPTK